MTFVDDWTIYRNDETAFDRYHFVSLLKDHHSTSELGTIFGGLDGADGAMSRITQLFDESQLGGFDDRLPRPERVLQPREALALTRSICAGQKKHLAGLGADDVADELDGLQVVMASLSQIKAEIENQDNLAYAIHDEIGDDYAGQPFEPRHVFTGLYEAALALTRLPAITRYLLDPIWPYSQKYDEDVALYLGGYTYFATNEAVLLAQNGS